MDKKTEALKLALEALELGDDASLAERDPAITAIREALAEHPVAWLVESKHGNWSPYLEWSEPSYLETQVVTPLYTSPPPKKEWVGLTDEERRSLREWQKIQEELGPVWAPMMLYLYEVIEAKLKEKNA